jgi:hypothetical protein
MMKFFSTRRFRLPVVLTFPLLMLCSETGSRERAEQFTEVSQLPEQVRAVVEHVRGRCKEEFPEMTFVELQGVDVLDLNGDGSRDIFVDYESLCQTAAPGVNCSNRGCDLEIQRRF